MFFTLAMETLSLALLLPHGGLGLTLALPLYLAIPPEGLTLLALPLLLSRMMEGGFVGLMLSNSA